MSWQRLKRTALSLEDLKPALWETLAPHLLHLVFLRLPVAQISQLRLLSKSWKAAIDLVESDFNMVLEDKVYPNVFGLIGLKSPWLESCLWMFDVNQDRWCVREINRLVDGKFTVGAADGGLVCFVSDTTEAPLIIVVMNPLTGKKVELPPLLCIYDVLPTIQPSMLQLKMNRKNNQYEVLFVGYIQIDDNRGLVAQVYDSGTREWSLVGSREKSWVRIPGYLYTWKNEGDYYDAERRGPCLYDFAQGQLRRFNVNKETKEGYTESYSLLQNRLFVLHTEERGDPSNLIQNGTCKLKYIITEYHLQQNTIAWVEWKTHGFEPFHDCPEENYDFFLHACNGYLMVMAHSSIFMKYVRGWLYNLSTYKWHVLPHVPGLGYYSVQEDLMCELRWSATP